MRRGRRNISPRILAEFAAGTAMGAGRAGPPADVTVLWLPTDHGDAMRAGLVDVGRREYLRRLAAVEKRLDQCGLAHERLTASAAEILESLKRHGLENLPASRARAVALLWTERQTRKPPLSSGGQKPPP